MLAVVLAPRSRRAISVAIGVLACALVAPLAGGLAQGQDDDAAKIARLEFKPGKPKTVTIYPGEGSDLTPSGSLQEGRLYWYLPYTLTNKSDKTASFFVTVRAYSDKGRRYSDLALSQVEDKVEKLEQRELYSKADLLEQGESIGTYLQFAPGDERECVAIFNPIDAEADKIEIHVHGLVDDIEVEELPGGGYRITERVLKLTYERPGDEFYTSLDAFEYKGQEWTKKVTETSSSE